MGTYITVDIGDDREVKFEKAPEIGDRLNLIGVLTSGLYTVIGITPVLQVSLTRPLELNRPAFVVTRKAGCA